jgi:hypothetical protein
MKHATIYGEKKDACICFGIFLIQNYPIEHAIGEQLYNPFSETRQLIARKHKTSFVIFWGYVFITFTILHKIYYVHLLS